MFVSEGVCVPMIGTYNIFTLYEKFSNNFLYIVNITTKQIKDAVF